MSEPEKEEPAPAKKDTGGPLFSRGGMTGPGKCSETLKTHVPYDTDQGFKELAAAAGCSPSELLRDMVCMAVHQKTYAEMVYEQRRRIYAKMGLSGPEWDPRRDPLPPAE